MLVCYHSNESNREVLSCGTVYHAVQGGSTFKSQDEMLVCDHSDESSKQC